MVTPRLPVGVEAGGFVFVGADVHCKQWLVERRGVRQCVQAGCIDGGEGYEHEIGYLARVPLALWAVVPWRRMRLRIRPPLLGRAVASGVVSGGDQCCVRLLIVGMNLATAPDDQRDQKHD